MQGQSFKWNVCIQQVFGFHSMKSKQKKSILIYLCTNVELQFTLLHFTVVFETCLCVIKHMEWSWEKAWTFVNKCFWAGLSILHTHYCAANKFIFTLFCSSLHCNSLSRLPSPVSPSDCPGCSVWQVWSEPTLRTATVLVCTHMSAGLTSSTLWFCCCCTTHWWLCCTNGSTSRKRFVWRCRNLCDYYATTTPTDAPRLLYNKTPTGAPTSTAGLHSMWQFFEPHTTTRAYTLSCYVKERR